MAEVEDQELEDYQAAQDAKPDSERKSNRERTPRDAELLGKDQDFDDEIDKYYSTVSKGFKDQGDRVNDILDYWDIYNCVLGNNQFYTGNAEIYVPIVHNAINARVTRFTNQVFPASGRFIECVTSDEELPHEKIALGEHYIERGRLRDLVVPALLRNGDIEGQWTVYVSWDKIERHVARRVQRPLKIDDMEVEGEEVEDIVEETIVDAGPKFEVVPDSDLLLLPTTADTVDEALEAGGSVTIIRRWSKEKIQQLIDDGEIIKEKGEEIIDAIDAAFKENTDIKKEHADDAGIHGKDKYIMVYETWRKLEVDGEKRLCRTYYSGTDTGALGAKQNPYWCGLCPAISAPVVKISGVFKGTSQIKPVQQLQYHANDAANQGADSATYGLMPIVMTDPISNPRLGSMVLDLAAVWQCDPSKTKFAEFPKLWQDALELVQADTATIFQTLSVNPSMIPGMSSSAKHKPSQAEVANEQQVDMLTTADTVTALEGSILTPLLQRVFWYDAQFRDKAITVKAFGSAGLKAEMQDIPPVQMNNRYWFKWLGVEQARSMQQQQQQIAFANVLIQLPPALIPGKKLDLTPLIERACENIFGARLASQVFKSLKDELSVDPEIENVLMSGGHDMPVSPFDDDIQHMQIHQQLMQGGDPHGVVRAHMFKHQMQMSQKQAAAAQNMNPSVPAGGGGSPKPGAQNTVPRNQGPSGMVHKDQMPDSMPRKM